jgi:hypothetical protein
MPNKTKSRNNSRKSTASSQGTPSVSVSNDEIPSIIITRKAPTSRKTTPKSDDSLRPEFMEPLSPKALTPTPPPTPWESLSMPEEDYIAMIERVKARYREMEREEYERVLLRELNVPRFWKDRIEHLEQEREYFNKKRGWSAIDIACVDRIDAEIEECESELERIYALEDRLEVEYD